MKRYFETEEFKRLDSEWKAKLKESGFEDLEDENENLTEAQISTQSSYAKGAAYYEAIERIVQEYPFKRETDRVILKLHSEGMSLRKIAERLQADPNLKPLKFKGVQWVIREILKDFAEKLHSSSSIDG